MIKFVISNFLSKRTNMVEEPGGNISILINLLLRSGIHPKHFSVKPEGRVPPLLVISRKKGQVVA